MAETVEDLKKQLIIWKENIEAKGLRVNVHKTKLACSKHSLSVKSNPVKWLSVFVAKVLALAQSSAKAVTNGFKRDA